MPSAYTPRLTRHRGSFAVYYYDDEGTRRRASLGTDDIDEARRRLATWRKAEPRTVFKGGSVVYFIQCDAPETFIKIGVARDLATRLSLLQVSSPYPLTVLATTPGGRKEEIELHTRFASLRVRGEWFVAGPELVAFIESVLAQQAEAVGKILKPWDHGYYDLFRATSAPVSAPRTAGGCTPTASIEPQGEPTQGR